MKTLLFFGFLTALAKAGLLITIGVLIKNHLKSFLLLITQKPALYDIVENDNAKRINNLIKWIGIFIIIIGIILALSAFTTLIMGLRVPSNNFNFKFQG